MIARSALSTFSADRRGNVAMMFGLTLLPLMLATGSAVDFGRASSEKARLQSAVDATALSLAREPKTATLTQLQAKADAYFAAAYVSGEGVAPPVTVAKSAQAITVASATSTKTAFMQLAGYAYVPINASSQVTYGRTRIEVALVLDNTGSMGQFGKMPALQSAAATFLDQLVATAPVAGDVRVSIVPFATQVNVGKTAFGQSWLDASAVSAATWTGCVADRDQPYDVNADSGMAYPARNCAAASLSPMMGLTDLSLASDLTALKARIAGMTPSGNTNLTVGLAWGLATLTPGSPAPGAAAFGTADVEKFMVLLTDGDNTQNRWTGNAAAIDQRSRLACDAAKASAKKITVFTIRVIQGNATLLRDCASTPAYYFEAADASQIAPAFNRILEAIVRIRLTH